MTVKDYLSSDVLTKNKNYEIGHNDKNPIWIKIFIFFG